MSILIVDDFEEQRELLAATLQQAGYRSLEFAASAADALKRLKAGEQASSGNRVDIVLMDLLMPDMDGLEACRKIREDERYEHLPVIVVTAKTDPNNIKAAYNAGATDYIRKPVIPAELVARVSMAMSMKEELDNRVERERDLSEQTRVLGQKAKELDALKGSLCVCPKCKRVKTAAGLWQRIEDYLEEKMRMKVTSGACNRCGSEQTSGTVHARF